MLSKKPCDIIMKVLQALGLMTAVVFVHGINLSLNATVCNDYTMDFNLFLKVQYRDTEMAMYVDKIPSQSCIAATDLVMSGIYFVLLTDNTVPRSNIRINNKIKEHVYEYHFGSPYKIDGPVHMNPEVELKPLRLMKKPLSKSEKSDSNIRIKVINYLHSVNIYLHKEKEVANELLMQLKEGEESYLKGKHGTALVATMDGHSTEKEESVGQDEINNEQYFKQQIISSFTINQSGVRVWMIVDLKSSNVSQITRIKKYAQLAHAYYSETGRHWIQYIDSEKGRRPPPHLHMWSADKIGSIRSIFSEHVHWSCDQSDGENCPSKSNSFISFQIETLSTNPKIFLIRNFLSQWECLHLRSLAEDKLKPSVIAASARHTQVIDEDIRFSSTAWLNRKTSLFVDTLYRRVGDVMNIDERKLHKFVAAEDIQVVKYATGGYYRSHLDWGEHGSSESRYISFLMYLNDPMAGGETAFPLADERSGFKIHPGEGSVIFFYNLLADGNGDELVEHAALPVLAGEKWMANLWIWDPLIKYS